MSVRLDSGKIEFYIGAVWTDYSADVIANTVQWKRGIDSSDPRDRVASAGTLQFDLRNDSRNSAATLGRYSPGKVGALSGFDIGTKVLLTCRYSATDYRQFVGRIVSIAPTAGAKRAPRTSVIAADWIEEAAEMPASKLTLQIDQRADQIVSYLTGLVPVAPEATSYEAGIDTFPYALDQSSESGSILSLQAKATLSELGYLFIKRDGTWTFENRHARAKRASVASFVNTMRDLTVARARDKVMNRVVVTAHPRRVDAAATTVLYKHDAAIKIDAGQTVTLDGPYRDPANEAVNVGGRNMVAFTANTDYTMNSAEDGTGTNLTTSLDTTGTFTGAAALRLVLKNNASVTGYVRGPSGQTGCQIRGKGIYDYSPITAIVEDATSQASYGVNELPLDMAYQPSSYIASGAASWLNYLWGGLKTHVLKMPLSPHDSSTQMTNALNLEIGQRITVTEDVTGVSADFYINGVEGRFLAPRAIEMTWTLTPADAPVWILDDTVLSVMDTSTIPGWI